MLWSEIGPEYGDCTTLARSNVWLRYVTTNARRRVSAHSGNARRMSERQGIGRGGSALAANQATTVTPNATTASLTRRIHFTAR
jgi:hypothetical protein